MKELQLIPGMTELISFDSGINHEIYSKHVELSR